MFFASILSVAVGSAFGALLRWWLALQLNGVSPGLPLGTLAANLFGGYLMGLCMVFFQHHDLLSVEYRLVAMTGFLGGLTTFSTFSAETVGLLMRGELAWAGAMIAAHVGGSLAATSLGVLTMRLLLR